MRRAIRCFLVISGVLLLAGCVAVPPPQPFRSPLVKPFDSPIPTPTVRRYYLPTISHTPGKAGISMAVQFADCRYPAAVGASWYYDWSPQPLQCPGLDAVPMLWAPGDGVRNPPTASEYLLLLNECDRADQCNTSPEAAARAWRAWEQQYPDRKLVGPNASETGWQWEQEWYAAYQRLYGEPPRIYALGVHCYNNLIRCQTWVSEHEKLARQWTESGQVWVTEWAMPLPQADVFLPWLLEQPGVAREAWYLARSPVEWTSLFDAEGLTDLGLWYQAAVAPHGW